MYRLRMHRTYFVTSGSGQGRLRLLPVKSFPVGHVHAIASGSSTLSNTTLSVPIYYLKGIGFVKRLYESGVIGLIGINLFIFIQKMTQTSSFVCLLVQTRLIVH